jgi:hypothetical protein
MTPMLFESLAFAPANAIFRPIARRRKDDFNTGVDTGSNDCDEIPITAVSEPGLSDDKVIQSYPDASCNRRFIERITSTVLNLIRYR